MTKEDVFQQLLTAYIKAEEIIFDEFGPYPDFDVNEKERWGKAQGDKFLKMWQDTESERTEHGSI